MATPMVCPTLYPGITRDDIAAVRRDLPPVRVLLSGVEHVGHVSGRLNDYPTVWCSALASGVQFTWGAVAYAVKTGRVLRLN